MLQHVTVVIPALNAARHLPSAVESVREQTAADRVRRIIVVDDASTDDTASVAASLSADVLTNPGPPGAGPARNIGVEASDTEIIAFLDADDTWLPDFLEVTCGHLDATAEIDGVVTPWVGSPRAAAQGDPHTIDPAQVLLTLDGVPGCSGWCFRRSAITDAGGFDPTYRRFQDYELVIRMSAAGRTIIHTATPHFHYQDSVDRRVAWSAASATSLEQLARRWGMNEGGAEPNPLTEMQRRRVATNTLRNAAHVHAVAGDDASLARIMGELADMQWPPASDQNERVRRIQLFAGRRAPRLYGALVRWRSQS